MFVRQKHNHSGSITVQIISKKGGRYRVIETLGTSCDLEQIASWVKEAQRRISFPEGQPALFSLLSQTDIDIQNFLENLTNLQVRTIGPELIFGHLFDRIGFNAIPEELFRHITIARLAYPVSKLKTVEYLYRYRGISVDVDTIYRFLDKLADGYKEQVERIAYEYTQRTLKQIAVVFYDLTTLYFESEEEDDLRKIGFSKDGKFQQPQILLGLLVGQQGFPIGYDIFSGNTFEGHTLLPTLETIQQKYQFPKPIVIADAGLFSKKNVKKLRENGYTFILGARIKNEAESIKEQIRQQRKGLQEGGSFLVKKPGKIKLIITYSEKRRKKDAYNRERGLQKLRRKVKSGKLTKENINYRGYNKFLSLQGNLEIAIDEAKVQEDEMWDGLKGYLTNTHLSADQIVENYRHLWQIEKAFRISKTDLKIRPIHHYRTRRIQAHICIAFVAYTIWKELERLLEKYNVGFSPKRAAELTHTMYALEYVLPHSQRKQTTLLKMDEDQQKLYDCVLKS
jgi:transposase